jgi:hypothetical protein
MQTFADVFAPPVTDAPCLRGVRGRGAGCRAMSKPPPSFQIRESHTGRVLRLSIRGEPHIATAPVLETGWLD